MQLDELSRQQNLFCCFQVDENTRKSLYKLRSTWDEIFPSKKLYALDVRVNQVDPAWPVKPLPPNVNTASIHVNPKFLNKVSICVVYGTNLELFCLPLLDFFLMVQRIT